LNGGFDLTGGTLSFGITNLTSHGQLYLAGNPATLDGSISIQLNNGYFPNVGDSFILVDYASEKGIFSAFNLPPNINWLVNNGKTAFSLSVASLTAPFLTLQPVTPLQPTNGVTLLMLGPPNANYTIQAAASVSDPDWVTVTNFFITNSSCYYTDTNAAQYPLRIFRAGTQ
jgi:hypothetical protein